MIKVAVIDDALAGNLIVKNIRIMSYTEVCVREMMTSKETLLVMEEKGIPNSEIFSHGTNVLNTIYKYADGADMGIYYYNIFDSENCSSGILLVETIKKILKKEVDFIVISLSCPEKYRDDFLKLETQVRITKTILIAASDNFGVNTMPAYLDFVYGVGTDNSLGLGAYIYRKRNWLKFYCNTAPEFIGELGKIDIFCGTSKGTAVIAGRLIAIMDKYGKEYLFDYLSCDKIADDYYKDMERRKYKKKEFLSKLEESFSYDFTGCDYFR